MALNFNNIPDPAIIEELDFELILEGSLVNLQDRDPSYSEILESDPGVKVLEVGAYREMLMRARVNDALRATLVRFAMGTDLDNIASNYQVERLVGETDAQLRLRTTERIRGSSAAGSEAWYRFHALTADVDIAEIGVSSPRPGYVQIAVLSQIGDGTPSQTMLDAVTAAVDNNSVRVVTDFLTVEPATVITVPVTATVYLLPDAPMTVFDTLPDVLTTSFEAEAGLGWDVTTSWIIAALHVEGVQRVELAAPSENVICDGLTAPSLGAITLSYGGRDR